MHSTVGDQIIMNEPKENYIFCFPRYYNFDNCKSFYIVVVNINNVTRYRWYISLFSFASAFLHDYLL